MASPNKPRFIELNVKQLDQPLRQRGRHRHVPSVSEWNYGYMRTGHNLIIEEKPDWLQTQIDAAYD